MQHTTHHSGRLGHALCVLAIAATLLLLSPASALAGRVFIDPGHGGSFPGAVHGGVREAEINLAISLQLERLLLSDGHSVELSRRTNSNVTTTDTPTWVRDDDGVWHYRTNGAFNVYDDLQARCDRANAWGADIFVSIHANAAASSSANGAETFWRDESETDRVLSARLAGYIQQEYVLETGLSNRGVKNGQFYVLRWSNMPAILVEAGFMTNASDLAQLTTPDFQRRAARGIARGIERFLAEDPFSPLYPRISGANRYATAVALAEEGWSATPASQTVILASGANWPDALGGTPLSLALDAPMLLTDPNHLSPATRDRITAQSPSRIVVLGGVRSISETAVAAAVEATRRAPAAVTVERIAGNDRFETAAQIARRVTVPQTGRVIVASGRTYADALSIAPVAGATRTPILLVEPDHVPAATRRFIEENEQAITGFEVVGGELAVDNWVVAALEEYAPAIRTAGPDRYRTNITIIERHFSGDGLDPLVATGRSYADALTASAFASHSGRPVLLVDGPRHLPAHTREFLINNAQRASEPTIVGGPSAISHQMEWMIQKAYGR